MGEGHEESGREVLSMVKDLLRSEHYTGVENACLRLMSCLCLGRLEKGSLLFDTKVKSFQQRWMGAGNKALRQRNANLVDGAVCDDVNSIHIERDSLITLNCKRGGVSSIEYYRVLYNKWYPADLDKGVFKFAWDRSSNKVHFLVRMMNERGASYEEVELKKNWDFRPMSIFRICSMDEILDVKTMLVDF